MFDQQNPTNRDGQISLSAVEAMAQQAAGVIAYPGAGTFYQSGMGQTFSQDATSLLTVEDSGGAVSVANVTTISLDEDYFTVTDGGDGTASVSLISSSAITVAENDGSPSYSGVGELWVNASTGLAVTQPIAGKAMIANVAASETLWGVVTTGGQTIAGAKRFATTLAVGADTTYYSDLSDGFIRFGMTDDPDDFHSEIQHFGDPTDPSCMWAIYPASGNAADGCYVSLYSSAASTGFSISGRLGAPISYGIERTGSGSFLGGYTGTIAGGATSTGGIITAAGTLNLGGIADGTYPP